MSDVMHGPKVRHGRARRKTYGRNELQVRQATPEFVKFLLQFKNFFALLLIGGGALAVADTDALPGAARALETMVLCNSAQLTEGGFSGDATDGALLLYADRRTDIEAIRKARRIAERPFDSALKRMGVVVEPAGAPGPVALVKGAPEVVLGMCDRILLDDGELPLDAARRRRVIDDYCRLAGRGERGLALAWRAVDAESAASAGDIPDGGYVFLAIVGMIDPPRPEVPEAMATCRAAGIKVAMLTGDYGLTAETIARQIGLLTGRGTVVQGDELAAMDEAALRDLLRDAEEIVFARTTPAQKLRVVQAFQALGETVTVTFAFVSWRRWPRG